MAHRDDVVFFARDTLSRFCAACGEHVADAPPDEDDEDVLFCAECLASVTRDALDSGLVDLGVCG